MKKHPLIIAGIVLLAACQSSTKQEQQQEDSAAAALTPAKPAGQVQVAIAFDKDTQRVKIRFALDTLLKEKTFEAPLAKDVDTADLYRVVWDKPNSCYIGVLKKDHSTRYYHASRSEDGRELKINHVGTPPEAVWHYAEQTLGLGKIKTAAPLTEHYKQNFQSGRIIADFIVNIRPASTPDSIQLYSEFGGGRKTQVIPVPQGYKPGIRSTGRPDHCVFGLVKDGAFEGVMDIRVENGHLQITELKRIN